MLQEQESKQKEVFEWKRDESEKRITDNNTCSSGEKIEMIQKKLISDPNERSSSEKMKLNKKRKSHWSFQMIKKLLTPLKWMIGMIKIDEKKKNLNYNVEE